MYEWLHNEPGEEINDTMEETFVLAPWLLYLTETDYEKGKA